MPENRTYGSLAPQQSGTDEELAWMRRNGVLPPTGKKQGGLVQMLSGLASNPFGSLSAGYNAVTSDPLGVANNLVVQPAVEQAQWVNDAMRGQVPLTDAQGRTSMDAIGRGMDIGGMFAGGGLANTALRGGQMPNTFGSLGGGAKLKKEDLDPLGYSGTLLPKHIDEFEIGIQPTAPNLPRKQLDIADLEGKVALPLYGDRSAAGGMVSHVDGEPLAKPVYREGGPDFMVGPAAQADNAFWASRSNISGRLAKRAEEIKEKTGRDVIGSTITMSPDAVDHAVFTSKVVANMLPNAKITKKAFKAFDDKMKEVDDNWPGADSENLDEYLSRSSSEVRKEFIRTMEKSPFQKAGFPNIGAARKAVTEPDLFNKPTYQSGFAVAQFDDSPLITNPSVPHSTYDTQLKGDYLGGFESLVPQDLMFRDAAKEMRSKPSKTGKPLNESQIKYGIDRKLPGQIIDAQMVDEVSRFLESLRN